MFSQTQFDILLGDASTNINGTEEADIFSDFTLPVFVNFLIVDIVISGAVFDCNSDFTLANDLHTAGFTLVPQSETTLRLTYPFQQQTFQMDQEPKFLFTARFVGEPDQCYTYTVGDARYVKTGVGLVVSNSVGDFKTGCLPSFTVSGNVARPAGVAHCDNAINGGVDNVIVCNETFLGSIGNTCQENYCDITTGNGNYSLLLNPNLDQTVFASTEAALDCGIETADADLIQAHILTQNIFDEVWEYLAADVNFDEQVTGADIVNINKIVAGQAVQQAAWYFPTSESYSPISYPFITPHPEVEYELEYNSMSTVTNKDFVAIKNGDLNTTCTACGDQFQDTEIETRSNNTIEEIWAEITNERSTFEITDSKMLTRIHLTSESKLTEEHIKLVDRKGNVYHTDYFQDPTGIHHYYALLVKSDDLEKPSTLQVSIYGIDLANIHAEYADINYDVHDIVFLESKLTVYPNPTSDLLNINSESAVKYDIINSSGEYVKNGYGRQVDISSLNSGIYIIYVQTGLGTQQAKFVKI